LFADRLICPLAGRNNGSRQYFLSDAPADIEAAIATCHRCPVLEECKAWADATDVIGVVAGERRVYVRDPIFPKRGGTIKALMSKAEHDDERQDNGR